MLLVSYSRIRRWRRCRKAHDYRYNQRLTRKRKHVPLFKGTLIHEMLSAQTLLELFPTAPRENPERILRKAQKKYRIMLKEEQESYGDIIGDVQKVFEAYNRHYRKDPLTPLTSEEYVETLLSPDIKFIGYIDNRVRDSEGSSWIRDYKTCTSIPEEEARFSDIQLNVYAWAFNREHQDPDKQVRGIMWDYIRTKPPTIPEVLKNGQLSRRANIDTDYYTYKQAILDNELEVADYRGILTELKKKQSTRFRRIKYPLPPKKAMEQIVEDLRSSAIEIQVLGTRSKTRTMSHDCKSCEFFSLCQAELRGLDTNFIRKSDYTEQESDHGEESIEAALNND